jgi:hypothetical protein
MYRILFLVVMVITAGCVGINTEGDPTDVGEPTGNLLSQTIGPEGGILVSEDGSVTLTVPEDAVSSDTEFSIQPITNNLHGGIGGAYRIEPGDVPFNQPVEITVHYTEDDLTGTTPEALGLAYQDEDGIWYKLQNTTINPVAKTLTVSTDHLSDWAKRADYRLKPGSATVKVGEEIGLQLIVCALVPTEDADPDDELAPLPVQKCSGDGEFGVAKATEWAVNGIPGGNSTLGTLGGEGRINAFYQAPQTAPEPNTVAVSARVEHPAFSTSERVLVVSHITIVGDVEYEGTINIISGPPYEFTAKADVQLSLVLKDFGGLYYNMTGTFTLTSPVDTGDSICDIQPAYGPIENGDNGATTDLQIYTQTNTYDLDFGANWDATWNCRDKDTGETYMFTAPFGFLFLTMGPDCMPATLPLNNIGLIKDSFTFACGYTVTADWEFTEPLAPLLSE